MQTLARNWWVLVVRGALAILFAILVVLFPGEGAVAIVWAIGTYAVVFGILLIALGIRLRRLHVELERPAS
jgi:uncharacterized membrane protein HdeD (DUF308 family)